MQGPITKIEGGTTVDLTVTYSSQPGTTPYLSVYAGSGEGTLIHSATTVASSPIEYHAAYTTPASRGFYSFTFTCSFTQGPVITPGTFQIEKTTPGRY